MSQTKRMGGVGFSAEEIFKDIDAQLKPAPPDIMAFAKERNQRFRARKRPDKLDEPLDHLSQDEEAALFKELRKNPDKAAQDEIKECLVNSQEAWIATLARRRAGGGKKYKNLLDAAIQAGRRGALEAIKRFDIGRGTRFNTYATFWINREISDEMASHDPRIRLPEGLKSHLQEYYRACDMLFDARVVEPSAEQIHRKMTEDGSKLSLDDARLIHQWGNPFSLDKPVGEDGDANMSNFVPQTSEPPPDEQMASIDEAARLHGILNKIPPGDRMALKLHWGIGTGGGKSYSFEEISRGIGWSGGRSRQIIGRAMRYAEMNKDAAPQKEDNREVYVFENLLLPLSETAFTSRDDYKREGLKVAGRGEDGPLFLKLIDTPEDELVAEVAKLRRKYRIGIA
jgi:RNA polymerase primary sigma factor